LNWERREKNEEVKSEAGWVPRGGLDVLVKRKNPLAFAGTEPHIF